MCGIVGMITKNRFGFQHQNLKVFEQLLFLDTLRGDDSTGVFAVNNLGNVGIAKSAVTGEQFIKTKEWETFRGELFRNGWAVVGHNRKATRGKVNDDNAHPFWVEDKLVLVHNGSFYGSHNHLKDTEVDSHAIAHTLAEHGSDDIAGALKKVNAAYALVWYDVEKKQLNIIRNDQRPLHFVETGDAWYFASEYQMLEFVLSRERIKVDDAIYSFDSSELNSWTLKDDHTSVVSSNKIDCAYKYTAPPPSQVSPKSAFHNHSYNAFAHHHGACDTPPVENKATSIVPFTPRSAPIPPVRLAADPDILTSNKVPVMPWMTKKTLRVAKGLFDFYKVGSKIMVEVDDFVSTGDNLKYFTVTGNTLDEHRMPVAFNVSKTLLDSLTNPETTQVENAVFEIEVQHNSWKRTDVNEPKDIDDAEGVMIVIGKNPVLRFDGRGHGIQ